MINITEVTAAMNKLIDRANKSGIQISVKFMALPDDRVVRAEEGYKNVVRLVVK